MRRYISLFLVVCFALTLQPCSQANAQSTEISALRDSLDAIQYEIPSIPATQGKWTVVKVRKQKEWDEIVPTMKTLLEAGQRNIEVRITGKNIMFGQEQKVAQGWNYPKANIWIVGKKAKMLPYGLSFSRNDWQAKKEGGF